MPNSTITLKRAHYNWGSINDSAINGNYLYIVARDGLHIVSLKTFQKIKTISSNGYSFNDIWISNNRAFVTSGNRSGASYNTLQVYNISSPANTHRITYAMLQSPPISVIVKNNYVYVGDFEKGLVIYKFVADSYLDRLSSITPTTSILTDSGLNAHSWWIALSNDDNYVYMPYDSGGFNIINVTNKLKPRQAGHFDITKKVGNKDHDIFFNDVAIKGTFAYVTVDYAGMIVLDISNPYDPQKVAWVDPWPNKSWNTANGHMIQIEIKDSIAYLAADEDGIYMYNIANPTSPMIIDDSSLRNSLNMGKGHCWGIFANNNYLGVAYADFENFSKGSYELYTY